MAEALADDGRSADAADLVLQTLRLKSSFSLAELDQLGTLLAPLASRAPEKEFELRAAIALVHHWKRVLNRPSKKRRRSSAPGTARQVRSAEASSRPSLLSSAATSASQVRSAETSSGPSLLSSLLLAIPILALWAAWIAILVGAAAMAIAAVIGVDGLRLGLTAIAILAIIVLLALADLAD
jgi:hypothetical protein